MSRATGIELHHDPRGAVMLKWSRTGATVHGLVTRAGCQHRERFTVRAQPNNGNVCRHCARPIQWAEGTWTDPEAPLGTDDAIWRETCDASPDFIAVHEPMPTDVLARAWTEAVAVLDDQCKECAP